MEIGMIGLGRMESSMVRCLLRAGHQCVVYDPHPVAAMALVQEGAVGTMSLEDFAGKLKPPRAAWLMVPAALLSPMIAGAAMSLSSVSVIGNALQMRKVRL